MTCFFFVAASRNGSESGDSDRVLYSSANQETETPEAQTEPRQVWRREERTISTFFRHRFCFRLAFVISLLMGAVEAQAGGLS